VIEDNGDFVGDTDLCPGNSTLYERSTASMKLYVPLCAPTQCWSKVKAILRAKAARTLEALEQAIAEALAAITSQDAHGWFVHAGYCVASN